MSTDPETHKDHTVTLPHLGTVHVAPIRSEPGHWLWLDLMGWHDCTRGEDRLIEVEVTP